jgi:hypothetical protein
MMISPSLMLIVIETENDCFNNENHENSVEESHVEQIIQKLKIIVSSSDTLFLINRKSVKSLRINFLSISPVK